MRVWERECVWVLKYVCLCIYINYHGCVFVSVYGWKCVCVCVSGWNFATVMRRSIGQWGGTTQAQTDRNTQKPLSGTGRWKCILIAKKWRRKLESRKTIRSKEAVREKVFECELDLRLGELLQIWKWATTGLDKKGERERERERKRERERTRTRWSISP